MKKDFKEWHHKKEAIEHGQERPHFHIRDIWYCALGVNVGFEQDGRGEDYLRPVVIVRKFNNEVFWGIPLTRTDKKSKYYFAFKFRDGIESMAILSQIRLIDAKRLSHHLGVISEADFVQLTKKLKGLMP